jgi:DNA-binding MarR family transcriptional regulator
VSDARPGTATPTREELVSFLAASADEWATITGDVDKDAVVLFGLIEAIARTWKGLHADSLAIYDLNLAEWTTVGMLRTSPPVFRRSPTELRRLVGQTSAGMTRILAKLGERRLVRREPSPSDGRGQDVILTRRGHELADQSFRRLHGTQRELLAPFSNRELARLISVLDDLRLALDRSNGRGSAHEPRRGSTDRRGRWA